MLEIDNLARKPQFSLGLLAAWLIAVAAAGTIGLLFADSAFQIVALGLCLAAVMVLRFDLFFYAQIFVLPWYPLLDARLPVRDVFLVLRFVLLAGVLIWRVATGRSVTQWLVGGSIRKIILIFATIATVSLLASAEGPNTDAARSLARWFSYLALFYAASGRLESKEQMQTVIKVILCSGMLVALFGLYQVLAKGYSDLYYYLYPLQEDSLEDWNGRITSFLFHFNSLAGYLNLVLALSLAAMVLAKELWVRGAALACHGMALAALYFTGSRGGLIAYAAMLLASMYFLKPRRTAFLRVLSAMAVAWALVAVLQLLPSRIEVEGESRFQQVDEFTSISRLALWNAAGAMFVQHPVLGVGYGNYRSLYSDYIPGAAPNELDAHNMYLQMLSETGVIGFLAFSVLLVGLAIAAIKAARNPDPLYRLAGIAMGGALVATLTHGMVDYLFNVSPQFGGLFWLMMAVGLAAYEQSAKVGVAAISE
jgi:putative inorganic carbon (hco3(-)) transporter